MANLSPDTAIATPPTAMATLCVATGALKASADAPLLSFGDVVSAVVAGLAGPFLAPAEGASVSAAPTDAPSREGGSTAGEKPGTHAPVASLLPPRFGVQVKAANDSSRGQVGTADATLPLQEAPGSEPAALPASVVPENVDGSAAKCFTQPEPLVGRTDGALPLPSKADEQAASSPIKSEKAGTKPDSSHKTQSHQGPAALDAAGTAESAIQAAPSDIPTPEARVDAPVPLPIAAPAAGKPQENVPTKGAHAGVTLPVPSVTETSAAKPMAAASVGMPKDEAKEEKSAASDTGFRDAFAGPAPITAMATVAAVPVQGTHMMPAAVREVKSAVVETPAVPAPPTNADVTVHRYEVRTPNALEVSVSAGRLGPVHVTAELQADGSVSTKLQFNASSVAVLHAESDKLSSYLVEQSIPVHRVVVETLKTVEHSTENQASVQSEPREQGQRRKDEETQDSLRASAPKQKGAAWDFMRDSTGEDLQSGMPLATSGGWLSVRV